MNGKGSDIGANGDHDDRVAYLLAELTNSRELMSYYAQRSEKRVDVLLVILTAVVAGLALLSQARLNLEEYWSTLTIASLGMTILSIYTTFYVLAADGHVVDRGHTIQRIRMYFVARHQDLRDTVLTPLLRADGSVIGTYGNWRLPMLVCAVSSGSFVSAMVLFIGEFRSADVTVLAVGCIAALWVWLGLEWWFRRQYNSIERALNTTQIGKQELISK